MQNKLIISVLLAAILFLLYVLYTNNISLKSIEIDNPIASDITDDTNDVTTEPFLGEGTKKKVKFCQKLDVRTDGDLTYYGGKIDDISDNNIDRAMDDLLDQEIVSTENKSDTCNKAYESLNDTNQDQMFDELERELKQQYEDIYQKDGYFKSIERPDLGSALVNGGSIATGGSGKVNSDLNSSINLKAFDPTAADLSSNKTIWELHDEMTTNNFKQYSNLDQLEEKNDPSLYNIGSTDDYGNTKFDTYGL